MAVAPLSINPSQPSPTNVVQLDDLGTFNKPGSVSLLDAVEANTEHKESRVVQGPKGRGGKVKAVAVAKTPKAPKPPKEKKPPREAGVKGQGQVSKAIFAELVAIAKADSTLKIPGKAVTRAIEEFVARNRKK